MLQPIVCTCLYWLLANPHTSRRGIVGYWCSTKGCPLDLDDMSKLMGFHLKGTLVWKDSMSPNQLASCLGNGCSVTVLNKILPAMMFAAGLITQPQFKLLQHRAEESRMRLKSTKTEANVERHTMSHEYVSRLKKGKSIVASTLRCKRARTD